MLAQDFCSFPLPAMPETGIFCLGLRLDDAPAWIATLGPLAAQDELEQAARFVHDIDAARHLAGRALVRRVLRNAFGQTAAAVFLRTPQGKPFCPEAGADFSISHSGVMVWTAFCRNAPVGIDVENARDIPDMADLTTQLHPEECAALRCLPPHMLKQAFYRCWTRKEAVLKALGTGLNQPLQSFRVSTGPGNGNWIITLPQAAPDHPFAGDKTAMRCQPDGWTSRDIVSPSGYQCSVAACAPELEVHACLM